MENCKLFGEFIRRNFKFKFELEVLKSTKFQCLTKTKNGTKASNYDSWYKQQDYTC